MRGAKAQQTGSCSTLDSPAGTIREDEASLIVSVCESSAIVDNSFLTAIEVNEAVSSFMDIRYE